MVKCIVSRCTNRMVTVNRGALNRPRKRFYHFPKDPARVTVWLAALRETHQQDSSEQHFICEDHFLPEDISTNGLKRDTIPIMPPYLDGPLGLVSPWGAYSSEEEEQWATGGCKQEEEEEDESGEDASPAPDPPQQVNPPEAERTSASLQQMKESNQSRKVSRNVTSLGPLTLRFLELLLAAPYGAMDLRDVAARLQTHIRRVYDITHILKELNLVDEESTNWVKWIGKTPISSFLWKNQQRFQRELENLQQVEEQLDGLIKRCSQQLFHITDDVANSASAYVTQEDIRRLRFVQQQTVIMIKAPGETQMEVPAPQEDSVQVHLKAVNSPITVLTCELSSGDTTTFDPGFFLTLEESRVRITSLHTAEASGQSS